MSASKTFLKNQGVVASRSMTSAFSVLELLIVMAIIVILMAVIAPRAGDIMKGNTITGAGDQVVALLNNARNAAVSQNQPVEVRIYKFRDPTLVGSATNYQALQPFVESSTSSVTWTPLQKMLPLPQGAYIDSGGTLSPLIASNALGVVSTPSFSIPRVATNYSYVCFHFRADGTTDLNPNQKWFMTIKSSLLPDNAVSLPPNYTMIQILPFGGDVKVYRPLVNPH